LPLFSLFLAGGRAGCCGGPVRKGQRHDARGVGARLANPFHGYHQGRAERGAPVVLLRANVSGPSACRSAGYVADSWLAFLDAACCVTVSLWLSSTMQQSPCSAACFSLYATMSAYMLTVAFDSTCLCRLSGCRYWQYPRALLNDIERLTGMDAAQAFDSAYKLCNWEGPAVAQLVAELNVKATRNAQVRGVRSCRTLLVWILLRCICSTSQPAPHYSGSSQPCMPAQPCRQL
jgi:hypothetical protein